VSWLRRVPAWVWLALLPAVGIALNEVRKGGRQRVEVVGAGPVAHLESQHAPPSARLAFDTESREAPRETAKRISRTLRLHPPLVVWGFDFSKTAPDRDLLAKMARSSKNAATVTVMLGPGGPNDLRGPEVKAVVDWWKRAICQTQDELVCVDLFALRDDPASVGPAVGQAIGDALVMLDGLRAATQVGR